MTLTSYAGDRLVYGGNALVQGALDDATTESNALAQIAAQGFQSNNP